MNRNRVKRSKKNLRQDAPLSFTESTEDTKNVPDPNGETPPPDQDPDK